MFTQGQLVWRPVVCPGGKDIRKKLVLETKTAVYDGYGIELQCREIASVLDAGMFRGYPAYELEIKDNITVIQKICDNVFEDDVRSRSPLYHPRPNISPPHTKIVMEGSYDQFAYFLKNAEPNLLPSGASTFNGKFVRVLVKDPDSDAPVWKFVLELNCSTGALRLLVDHYHHNCDMSRCFASAIHGEVRAVSIVHRLEHPEGWCFASFKNVQSGFPVEVEKNKAEEQVVAVKTVIKPSLRLDDSVIERPLEEIKSMLHISTTHGGKLTNVAKLMDVVEEHLNGSPATSAEGNVYIVMPMYAGGELLRQVGRLALDYYAIHDCFCQLAKGIGFLHSARCNHRDISFENVLLRLAANGSIEYVIIDFGSSVIIPVAGSVQASSHGTIRGDGMLYGQRVYGKEYYFPVEFEPKFNPGIVSKDMPTRGFPSDIWALGVMLLSLVTGNAPFNLTGNKKANYVSWIKEIHSGRLARRLCAAALPHTGRRCELGEHPCYPLLRRMLAWPEADRITIDEILMDNWVVNGGNRAAVGV